MNDEQNKLLSNLTLEQKFSLLQTLKEVYGDNEAICSSVEVVEIQLEQEFLNEKTIEVKEAKKPQKSK
jgi:hypothetical protein